MENFIGSLGIRVYTKINYHNVIIDSKDKATKKSQTTVNFDCFIIYILSPKMQAVSHCMELLFGLVVSN